MRMIANRTSRKPTAQIQDVRTVLDLHGITVKITRTWPANAVPFPVVLFLASRRDEGLRGHFPGSRVVQARIVVEQGDEAEFGANQVHFQVGKVGHRRVKIDRQRDSAGIRVTRPRGRDPSEVGP